MIYSIKNVAEKTGLTNYTIRYYEKIGLLPHISRNSNGIRE
ncbi:MerR family DNA-binding transcriptional regulator, partial [uncultured Cetobacterium sp.]